MIHDSIQSPKMKKVSATYFVRHFADLKRTAERAPVYIEAHGKSGWALLSTDLLSAMTQGRSDGGASDRATLEIMLDTIPTRVTIVDDDLNITYMNLARRTDTGFGDEAIGAPISSTTTSPLREIVVEALERTRETGMTEIFEADSVRFPGRALRLATVRVPGGIALCSNDIGDVAALREVRARLDAALSAVRHIPGAASGTINLRGAVAESNDDLARVVGADPAMLAGTRLGTLFDMASRARINALVDNVLDKAEAGSAQAGLLAGGAAARPVMVGLSPLLVRQAVVGATFVIIPHFTESQT